MRHATIRFVDNTGLSVTKKGAARAAARLIDGKTGVLLSEFYGPKDSNRGLCTYRDGKFPSGECTWTEYLEKANQM